MYLHVTEPNAVVVLGRLPFCFVRNRSGTVQGKLQEARIGRFRQQHLRSHEKLGQQLRIEVRIRHVGEDPLLKQFQVPDRIWQARVAEFLLQEAKVREKFRK